MLIKNALLTVRLPKDELQGFSAYAASVDCKMSDLVRKFIQSKIGEHKSGNTKPNGARVGKTAERPYA
jgi:hypothetical protein